MPEGERHDRDLNAILGLIIHEEDIDAQSRYTKQMQEMISQNSLNDERVFFGGNGYFQALFADIDSAQDSIDIEVYLYRQDSLGRECADRLIAAAKRGVAVRLLVDGAGTPLWGGSLTRKLERSGIETKVYNPYPWGVWQWSRSVVKKFWLQRLIYLVLNMNARNHRKLILIDGRITYVGSFNIDQRHLKETQGGENWRDTAIRVCGVDLRWLYLAFEQAWTHRPMKQKLHELFQQSETHRQKYEMRLNHTRALRRALYKSLLRKVGKCQERVWITNAYFVPDNFLLKKLKDAARKGVDVRILLPGKSDVPMMPWASAVFYNELLKAGVRIFEYRPSMLHAKTLILDDWVLVGSSNLNHRSLLHDLEADLTVSSPACRQAICDQFLDDLTSAQEITADTPHRHNLYQRCVGRLCLYLRFMI